MKIAAKFEYFKESLMRGTYSHEVKHQMIPQLEASKKYLNEDIAFVKGIPKEDWGTKYCTVSVDFDGKVKEYDLKNGDLSKEQLIQWLEAEKKSEIVMIEKGYDQFVEAVEAAKGLDYTTPWLDLAVSQHDGGRWPTDEKQGTKASEFVGDEWEYSTCGQVSMNDEYRKKINEGTDGSYHLNSPIAERASDMVYYLTPETREGDEGITLNFYPHQFTRALFVKNANNKSFYLDFIPK